ncbi:YtxH domain-containing protein [Streptomyces sp. NPDC005012]|uniref:YtxH domain-containing protein n=1 Tax=unclassified Streptomyces TaxID=2593676 RepID=UPI0033A4846C
MRYRLTFMSGVALGYVLGAKAGRERYEQIMTKARQITENPAVRNTAETAAQQGRQVAGKAYHTVSDKMPDSVSQRVKSVRGSRSGSNGQHGTDDWGTGTV